MKAEELDHIRADVHAAILEAQQHDPTVTLEILWRLFDRIGDAATNPGGDALPLMQSDVTDWATGVLRAVQLRAVSKVPYGEPLDDTPEEHRD